MYGDFLGSSKTSTFQVKTAVATFGQLWEKFGLLLFQHLVILLKLKRNSKLPTSVTRFCEILPLW